MAVAERKGGLRGRNPRSRHRMQNTARVTNSEFYYTTQLHIHPCTDHSCYSSLTFGVIVLHATLSLIADLSSLLLSLFADWLCLSFLQNLV